jgi:predicted DNA-binding transcriptional regulator AlpA
MDVGSQAGAALAGLEPLIGVGALAGYMWVPVSTTYDWWARGLGPRAHRLGKNVKFAVRDVEEWLATTRESAGGAGGSR